MDEDQEKNLDTTDTTLVHSSHANVKREAQPADITHNEEIRDAPDSKEFQITASCPRPKKKYLRRLNHDRSIYLKNLTTDYR